MKVSDAKVRKNPDVAYQPLADGEGGVLLSLETGEYHGVNDTGGRIWNLIDGERTVPEIVAALRRELASAPESLEAEAAEFVESLRSRRLVTV
jgi:hypothetical protein